MPRVVVIGAGISGLAAAYRLRQVMPHIELPIQAGDDRVLDNMKRGYHQDDYRRIIAQIREKIPGCSIATDIIVGFPGESEQQFMQTYQVLADLRLDIAHLARYSMREGTVATRRMVDDVPEEEKMRRFRLLEDLQEGIVGEINAASDEIRMNANASSHSTHTDTPSSQCSAK